MPCFFEMTDSPYSLVHLTLGLDSGGIIIESNV